MSAPTAAHAGAGAHALPPGFQDLEPFVERWALKTSHERWMRRSEAPMEEIQRFYDAIYARAEDALAFLDAHPLEGGSPEVQRLACLLLTMGQAAIAVEMHAQPRSPHSVWPHSIRMTTGPWPHG